MRKYINYWGMLGTVIGVCMAFEKLAPGLVCVAVIAVSGVIYQMTEGD